MDSYDDVDSLGHALGMMVVALVKVGQDSAVEREQKRLAAVRELVMEAVYARDHGAHQPQFNNALEALAAVWPEVVEG